jgi:hypothetical protein
VEYTLPPLLISRVMSCVFFFVWVRRIVQNLSRSASLHSKFSRRGPVREHPGPRLYVRMLRVVLFNVKYIAFFHTLWRMESSCYQVSPVNFCSWGCTSKDHEENEAFFDDLKTEWLLAGVLDSRNKWICHVDRVQAQTLQLHGDVQTDCRKELGATVEQAVRHLGSERVSGRHNY